MKTPTLETPRLILRPITIADAQNAFDRWTSDSRVTKYMRYDTHQSVDDTKGWLEFAESTHDGDVEYNWAFVEKDTNYLFGSGSLFFNDEEGLFEIGYNIMYDHWNKGFATEAAKAMIEFARDVLKCEKLYGSHFSENTASGRVMMKNGYIPTGECIRKKFNGTPYTCKTYLLDLT